MKKVLGFLKESILRKNPVLTLFAGVTPVLATSFGIIEGAYMGVAAIVTLVLSCMIFRALGNRIPAKVRGIIHLLAVALVVSIIEILTAAVFPAIRENLGIYLPLLAVSGIVLPYAERFSVSGKSFGESVLSGLSFGIGFFSVSVLLSFIREFFGTGRLCGFAIFPERYAISLLTGPVGGFILLGLLLAVFRKYSEKKTEEEESK